MDSNKLIQQFSRDGYLYLPGFLSRHQVEEINEQLDAFIRDRLSGMAPAHRRYEVDFGRHSGLQD